MDITVVGSIPAGNIYETNTLPKFWIAPNDLKAQSFNKRSAKRLSKKGSKINAKMYKNKQAQLVYKPINFQFCNFEYEKRGWKPILGF